ncbi:MAG TPA: acetoin dehydrogenase dihydrolipoyllysine-residue acetyltransferase subunit [Paraburkholderia sp.]|nr:acetoin dehydrogenase dihydrolipoyllysine-residue acetyltransferase subunit [Paraburkholderia sp.]
MPTEVILPRVDMDMTEGTIAAWHVGEGDIVRAGSTLFEIETSKATMEVDAPVSGVIRHICAPVGQLLPVGTPVAWIYATGEAAADRPPTERQCEEGRALAAQTQAAGAVPATIDAAQAPLAGAEPPGSEPAKVTHLRATPAARRIARERGVPLQHVAGSGPLGRIEAKDVAHASISASSPANAVDPDVEQSAPQLHRQWLRAHTPGEVPLVLLHGFAAGLHSWRPFCHALERVLPCEPGMLALDLPSHGKSTVEAVSLDEIVASIDATLAAEGIRHCHLIGHSFGGALALATAAYGPLVQTRVRSLTLFAPAGLGPDSNAAFIRGITQATRRASFAAWLKQLFADPAQMDEMFVATAEQQLASPQVRARLAALAERFFPDGAQSLDLRIALTALTLPIRVVWGLQDRILPPRHADGLPGRVAVHRFARVGHLPQIEARDDAASIVAHNIASATPTRTEKDARDARLE